MTFDLCPNVIVDNKNPSKVYLRNTVTNNKIPLKDKTEIKIITAFIYQNSVKVEDLAQIENIDKSKIASLFKKLAKRNFLIDTSVHSELQD